MRSYHLQTSQTISEGTALVYFRSRFDLEAFRFDSFIKRGRVTDILIVSNATVGAKTAADGPVRSHQEDPFDEPSHPVDNDAAGGKDGTTAAS